MLSALTTGSVLCGDGLLCGRPAVHVAGSAGRRNCPQVYVAGTSYGVVSDFFLYFCFAWRVVIDFFPLITLSFCSAPMPSTRHTLCIETSSLRTFCWTRTATSRSATWGLLSRFQIFVSLDSLICHCLFLMIRKNIDHDQLHAARDDARHGAGC